MNPAFSDEAWQAYVASQPVVDTQAAALEELDRLGPFQTGPGATTTQEGVDALTAFVLEAEPPPPEEEQELPLDVQRALQARRAYDAKVLAALDAPLAGRAAPRPRAVSCSVAEYDPDDLLAHPPEDGDVLLFVGNAGTGKTMACDRHGLAEALVYQEEHSVVHKNKKPLRLARAEWAHSLEHHCKKGNLHQVAYVLGRWPSFENMTQEDVAREFPFLAASDGVDKMRAEFAQKLAEEYLVNNVVHGFWFGRRDDWRVRVFLFSGTTRQLKRAHRSAPAIAVVGFDRNLSSSDAAVLVSGIRARKRWLRVARHARVVAAAVAVLRSLW